MIRMVGPKLHSNVAHRLAPDWIGVARISTPCLMSSVSNPGSTKEGRTVVKFCTCRGSACDPASLDCGGAHLIADLNLPSIVSPCVWIASMLHLVSSARKTV